MVKHPLEPLSEDEVARAHAILQGHNHGAIGKTFRYIEVELLEPGKREHGEVLWRESDPAHATIPRRARVLAFCTQKKSIHVLTVDIGAGVVAGERVVEGVQPPMDGAEYQLCEDIAKAYPPMVEALRRRGITDMENVMFDPWCVGYFDDKDCPSRRMNFVIPFYRRGHPSDNGYACPIEGIECYVDLFKGEVVEFKDTGDMPLPPLDPNRNFAEKCYPGPYRTDIKPINITQPQGPSFTITGNNHVQWLDWSFRVGFNAREGLTFHTVSLKDRSRGGEQRKVAHRMSIAEMVVPYGDPKFPHYRKNAFDAGEDGLGRNAHSLVLGCDCVGEIRYLDAVFCDYYGGKPEHRKNVVCIHEEDYGTLWKHIDWRTGDTDVRRSRRLVVSFFCTVANYDYGFFWYFYQTGTVQMEVKATGILSVGALHPSEKNSRKYGTTVAPNLFAPIHQHFFVARLDMAVDGSQNRVVEVNSLPSPPGAANPHNNAFSAQGTVLKTEMQACRDMNLQTARVWKIESSNRKNAHGFPTAFKIVPGGNCLPICPDATYLRRAGFLRHHLWVTPHNEEERFPGGDYPNQNPGMDGLEAWTRQDRNVEDCDLVCWYIFGLHHIPRPEDWPVMPCEYIGFHLAPFGYFDKSPVLDVPPTLNNCHPPARL